jgi:hypothetical protein
VGGNTFTVENGVYTPANTDKTVTIFNIASVSVDVYDEAGNFVKTYSSVSPAAATYSFYLNGVLKDDTLSTSDVIAMTSSRAPIHTYYTVQDAEGNFRAADGTKLTAAQLIAGEQYLLAQANRTLTVNNFDLYVTTGYGAIQTTRFAGPVTEYYEIGTDVTVTKLCTLIGADPTDADSYNMSVLTNDVLVITDNEGNVTYAAIDKSGSTASATFKMPATGVASYLEISFAGIQTSVKDAIDTTTFKAGQTWNAFKTAVETAASAVAGVENFTVTGQVPSSAGSMSVAGTNITVDYTYTVAGVTQTGSTVVTLASNP